MKQIRIIILSLMLALSSAVAFAPSVVFADLTKLAATLLLSATWSGTLTQNADGGDVVMNVSTTGFRMDTADAADNKSWYLNGGGAINTSGTRGAYIELTGNELNGGRIIVSSGNSTGTATFGTRGSGDTLVIAGNTTGLTMDDATRNISLAAQLTSAATSDLGWSVVAGANTACNTTCTSACVFGQETTSKAILACTDATADVCLCAGAS